VDEPGQERQPGSRARPYPGPAPGEDPATLLRRTRHIGDPLADRVADSIARYGKGGEPLDVVELSRILAGLPRMDDAYLEDLRARDPRIATDLDALLEATLAMPSWHSDPEIAAGHRLFEENAVLGFVVLGCRSLIECYCWQTEAEVLGITHGLDTHINRRIPETAQFVLDVMGDRALMHGDHAEKHAALSRQGEALPNGLRSIQKVRLMHAMMRWLILHDPERAQEFLEGGLKHPYHLMAIHRWPVSEKGPPISQAYMAGTLSTFSLVVIEGFHHMGIAASKEEIRDFLHVWRVVGYKMGVDEALLDYFATVEDAQALHRAMMEEFRGPTAAGPMLARALENYMIANIVDRFPLHRWFGFSHFPRIVMWNLCARKTAAVVDMKPGWVGRSFGFLVWSGVRFVAWLGRFRMFKRLSDWVFNQLGRSMWGWRRSDESVAGKGTAKAAVATCPAHEAAVRGNRESCAGTGFVIDAAVADRMGIQAARD